MCRNSCFVPRPSQINLLKPGWLELTFGVERVGEIVDGDRLRLRFPTGGRQHAEDVAGGGSDLPPFVPGLPGRVVGSAFGTTAYADVEAALLPGFAQPRGFRF